MIHTYWIKEPGLLNTKRCFLDTCEVDQLIHALSGRYECICSNFPPTGHDHLMSQDVYEGLKYFTIE